MKKLLFLLMIIVSYTSSAQMFAGFTVSGNGIIIDAGCKIENFRASIGYNGSPSHTHSHGIGLIAYSFTLSEYDDGEWMHSLRLSPGVGYSLGTRNKESKSGTSVKIKDNSILIQLELSYQVSNLQLFINTNQSSLSYVGIGFRGHF